MDTLATIGKLASIVNMNGVIAVDNINDEIENALRPRTVFLNGPSYTALADSLVDIGPLDEGVRSIVRYTFVSSIGVFVSRLASVSAAVEAVGALRLNGGRPAGWGW
jgi:hypothetical protein